MIVKNEAVQTIYWTFYVVLINENEVFLKIQKDKCCLLLHHIQCRNKHMKSFRVGNLFVDVVQPIIKEMFWDVIMIIS